MAMSAEVRKSMRIATQSTAAAFLEDMAHLREVLARATPSRGEVRLLSNILRRLLIDYGGDLRKIAPPRIQRFRFTAPDNSEMYQSDRESPYNLFISGGEDFLSAEMRAYSVDFDLAVERPYSEMMTDLSLDGFLAQRVLCLGGKWANRRDVIKFVAVVSHGVHSQSATENYQILLAQIRRCVDIFPPNFVVFHDSAIRHPTTDFKFEKDGYDVVLYELLCTAHYLVTSPDILSLEAAVKAEFGIS